MVKTPTIDNPAEPDISHVNPAEKETWFGHPRQLARLFSTELWDIATKAGIEGRDFVKWLMYEHPEEDDLKLLRWSDRELGGDGYVSWYPFH